MGDPVNRMRQLDVFKPKTIKATRRKQAMNVPRAEFQREKVNLKRGDPSLDLSSI